MHCHLLVPDLFWPDPDFREIYGGLATPALLQLLGKGRRNRTEAASAEAWLCEQFGLEKHGDWPVAPYSLLADGGEPGDRHWLRADPVHLQLEGGRLILADSGMFSLSQQEAVSLTESLNAHFSADGLIFYLLRPDRWYVRTETAPALQTTALPEAAGRSIAALLPRGADAARWRARLNDIQMLLHGHAVNERRENAGELPINSVWLWGGGALHQGDESREGGGTPHEGDESREGDEAQDSRHSPFTAVWSRDPFAAGLAQAARIPAHKLPEDAARLLRASASAGVDLLVLDQLRGAARYRDAHAWRENLARLERDLFAPLLQALKQERIGMLSLHALGPGGALSAEVTRGDLRRFWRRAKPLADYA